MSKGKRFLALITMAVASLFIAGAASSVGGLDVSLVSQNNSSITLGWTPQSGYGYLFFNNCDGNFENCTLVSRTNDATRSTVRFSKGQDNYKVAVITEGNSGGYPVTAPPPPPPPPPSSGVVTQNIVNGSTIADIQNPYWRAIYDANADGIEDDPGKVEFYIDNVLVLTEVNPPMGDTFATGSPSASPGQHTFLVKAISDANVLLDTDTVTATVGSTPPPPPPPSGCALPAYPDASCTGVPSGTTLTPSGGMTISTAGAVINAMDITGAVVVNAPNVTIRNSRITSNSMWVVTNNSTGLLIEDSEIRNRVVSGQNNCHNGVGNSNFTLRRVEITGCENGLNIDSPGNVLMEDSWIHDLDTVGPSYVWGNSPHTDGVQVGGGANGITFRHNTIDPVPSGGGVTSGIILETGSPPNANVTFEDNYIDGRGASYAIYVNRQQTSNVFINRNKLGKGYGYTACVRLGITVTQFNENRDIITNALISPDNGFDGGCSN